MTALALDLLSAALALPEEDRLDLASRLLASVEGEADVGWEEAWLTELDRRESEAANGAGTGSAWTEAKARILARLSAE